MKLDTKKVETFTNQTDTKKIQMTLGDISPIAMILQEFTYKHLWRTALQEYLANARDAHREIAKESVPIEVTLPTEIKPQLKIRDFGPGLSPDRVENVFCQYGASTKRGDNIANGGFGIGAKIGFALGTAFKITSWHNGTKTVYLAHKANHIAGELEIIEQVNSTDATGVEIELLVPRENLHEAIFGFYRATFFWQVRPIIKGVTNEVISQLYLESEPLFETDNFLICEKSEGGRHRSSCPYATANSLFSKFFNGNWGPGIGAIIDGIPYELNSADFDLSTAGFSRGVYIWLRFGVGQLSVAADRENLVSNDKNESALKAKMTLVLPAVTDSFQSEVIEADSLSGKIGVAQSFQPILSNFRLKFEYCGAEYEVNTGNNTLVWPTTLVTKFTWKTAAKKSFDQSQTKTLNLSAFDGGRFVIIDDKTKQGNTEGFYFYGKVRTKVKNYFDKGLSCRHHRSSSEPGYIIEPDSAEQLAELKKLPLDELGIELSSNLPEPVRVERTYSNSNTGGRGKKSNDEIALREYYGTVLDHCTKVFANATSFAVNRSELDLTNTLLIKKQGNSPVWPELPDRQTEALIAFFNQYRGLSICSVNQRDFDKLTAENPETCFYSYLKKMKLTQAETELLLITDNYYTGYSERFPLRGFAGVDVKKIIDPKLSEAIRVVSVAEKKDDSPIKENQWRALRENFGLTEKYKTFNSAKIADQEAMLERYPLLKHLDSCNRADVIAYVNVWFNSKVKGGK